jgi:hypothetical protein
MPTLLSQQQVSIEWSDLNKWRQIKQPKSARVRSNGIHLSGIIDATLIAADLASPREIEEEEMPLRMCIGMAWENWIVGMYPDMVWQPGEWKKDGVFGTPDGVSATNHSLLPDEPGEKVYEEFKATYYSLNKWKSILDSKRYMWQLCANCYVLNTPFARLHVLWINGDYKPPSPQYYTYLIQFTEKELEQFWANVVMKNKHRAVEEKH